MIKGSTLYDLVVHESLPLAGVIAFGGVGEDVAVVGSSEISNALQVVVVVAVMVGC